MKFWLAALILLSANCFAAGEKPLSQLRLDTVEFVDTELHSVLEFLNLKAKEMNGRPSNFVLYDPVGTIAQENPKITLALKNIPFSEVVKFVTQLSRTEFLLDHRVVWIGKSDDLTVLKTNRSSRTSGILKSPAFARMSQIKVPGIDFSGTSLTEVVEGLRNLDRSGGGTGNFVVIPGKTIDPDSVKINLNVSNISLAELVLFTSELSGFPIRVDSNAIVFRAPDAREQPAPPRGANLSHFNRKIIDQVSLAEITVAEMIEFLRFHSKSPTHPNGINMIQLTKSEQTVTLDLKKVRFSEILRYFNEQTGTSFRIDGSSIQIIDLPPEK